MLTIPCAGNADCNPSPDGRYYVGHKSQTESGRTCQAWASYHVHTDRRFPDGSVDNAGNYCRNPHKYRDGLWCYTTPIGWKWDDWDECSVPDCGQSLTARYHVNCCGNKMLFHALNWLTDLPSVLWRCWFGDRKGIRPVKTEWWGASVVICLERGADLHMAQRIPLPLTVSCFSKIQTLGIPYS